MRLEKHQRSKSRSAGLLRELRALSGTVRRSMPEKLVAELATLVSSPPNGSEWLHEIKFDGYRMFCRIEDGKARFISRNGQDWTARIGPLAAIAAKLPARRVILDGEVVVLDKQGVSQFQLLQNAMGNQGRREGIQYYAFDVLYLEGFDLTGATLESRKDILERFLANARTFPQVQLSGHVIGQGAAFQRRACEAHLEGIVSKRRTSRYLGGRGADWLKCKCRQVEEFVIGGYTAPKGSRSGFGALLLGYFDKQEQLVYAGRVGTGFGTQLLEDLTGQLEKLQQRQCPFKSPPPGVRSGKMHWVRPELVAQVEFSNWTDDGVLRQSSFQGLRQDKPARDVRLELPMNGPA